MWIGLLLLVLAWAAAGALLRVDRDGLVEGLALWLALLAAAAWVCEVVVPAVLGLGR